MNGQGTDRKPVKEMELGAEGEWGWKIVQRMERMDRELQKGTKDEVIGLDLVRDFPLE